MRYLFFLLTFFISSFSFGQINQGRTNLGHWPGEKFGEVYFSFRIDKETPFDKLTRMVSIDNFESGTCYAYASEEQFTEFLKLGIEYSILKNPGDLLQDPKMLNSIETDDLLSWDYYPTYDAYVAMMYQFASNYPDKCQVFSIGNSVNGRQLLVAKISDNVTQDEAEPQFLYTGTIHGDETTGYILLLRLIDYLLSNYGTNQKVTTLVDEIEIFINPLSNPDGTYKSGNNTVTGAVRYNANNVDLNRNYPDPQDGPHPDGKAWQPETLAFMQFAEDKHFVMSANTHGGVEVLNYPWDTWSRLTADNSWWVYVCRQYVDTVHLYSPATYMDYLNNGITNGYAWYRITGGRQDYMNYFYHCREVTMEISDTKLLPASQLPSRWDWNYRSLLNYLQQSLFGVRGMVTDSVTGEPLAAKVEIIGHDMDESFVYTNPALGNYHRLLDAGTYNLTFTAQGHYPKTINGVLVTRGTATMLNVQLSAGTLAADFEASATAVASGETVNFTDKSFGNPVAWHWYFEGGIPSSSTAMNPQNIQYLNQGTFDVGLTVLNASGDSITTNRPNYISVLQEYTMINGTLSTCSRIFYDPGGKNNNYGNNQDFTLTVYPSDITGKIEVQFLQFSLESQSSCNYDWLKIFDGSSTSATLIGKYCGSTSPGTKVATNAAGSLTFQFHSDYSQNFPGWKAVIACRSDQSIELSPGWQGISSTVIPDDPDPEILLHGISNELIILQSESGVYWPQQNVNTLGLWDHEKGYQMKLSGSATLQLTGYLPFNRSLLLKQGWTVLPVLSNCHVSINDLLGPSVNEVTVIKEIAGPNVYWPQAGVYTLQVVEPGKSYMIKTTGEILVTFPVCSQK